MDFGTEVIRRISIQPVLTILKVSLRTFSKLVGKSRSKNRSRQNEEWMIGE